MTITSGDRAITDSYRSISLNVQSYSNKYSTYVEGADIVHNKAALETLKKTHTIDTSVHIELPTTRHGLFKLNLHPPKHAPPATEEPDLTAQFQPATMPTLSMEDVPLATANSAQFQPTVVPTIGPVGVPLSATPTAHPSAAPTAPPPISGLQPTEINPQGNIPAHSFLIQADVPVDQSKFYGSPYFLQKMGMHHEQNRPSLRFLGDPFYESRLINDAILKSTKNAFLNDDIATPEEQVKYLIDNTAEVSKDLNLALGVALSKDKIKSLKKDILWYVEQEVHGQKVLVPQVYLAQNTIDALDTTPGSVLRSRQGAVNIKAKAKVVNQGSILGKKGVGIQARAIDNQSVGNQQAHIESSAGAVQLLAQYDIHNSGKIKGATHVGIKSEHGNIFHTTKVNKAGTGLLAEASIESGGTLALQAKNDIISKAGRIKAQGDTFIEAERDVKFLTQKLKKKTEFSRGSSQSGFWSSSSSSKFFQETTTTHAGSSLDIGGNLVTKGRDITLMATNVSVAKSAFFKASRDFTATTAEELQEAEEKREEQRSSSGLFSSSSYKNSYSKKTKKVTHKRTQINAQKFVVRAGGDANFKGVEVRATSALTS
ncbi:MAG: hemagglutinin repeat-containing protein, partial [Bacteroidota bacterium]